MGQVYSRSLRLGDRSPHSRRRQETEEAKHLRATSFPLPLREQLIKTMAECDWQGAHPVAFDILVVTFNDLSITQLRAHGLLVFTADLIHARPLKLRTGGSILG